MTTTTTTAVLPATVSQSIGNSKMVLRAKKQQEGQELLGREPVIVAATASLNMAIEKCKEKVCKIAAECKAQNKRFRDRKFDFFNGHQSCFFSSNFRNYEAWTEAYTRTLRLGKIVKNPQFFIDGPNANDIQQGIVGDCWFLSALSTISSVPNLLNTICVARNEEVGVYGFIFFKDGDWISTVVDDQLALQADDKHGGKVLLFSCSTNPQESWVPLIEKAFAKIHGDYESIEAGHVGDGVEDLTGGVSTQFVTADILDVDRFWKEEMLKANTDRLIGCSHHTFYAPEKSDKNLVDSHAYCVLNTFEEDGVRLVKVRNPWGTFAGEWTGEWSDGSEKWTPEWMEKLAYRFGHDGTFWMSYADFLDSYQYIDRTRLFNHEWHVATQWINYNVVPKSHGKFLLTITADNEPTIIVLSKPDVRYTSGEVKYSYDLSFYVYAKGAKGEDYLCRSSISSLRSVNMEVVLPAGVYEVVPMLERSDVAGLNDEGTFRRLFAIGKLDEANSALGEGGLRQLTENRRIWELERAEREGEEIRAAAEAGRADWEIMIGLRVYSKDNAFKLLGIQNPDQFQAEEESKKRVDPEEDEKSRATKPSDGMVVDEENLEQKPGEH